MGLRNSTSGPSLRVRVGSGDAITQSSNSSDKAYIDISDFPRDGASHKVVVEIFPSPLQVFCQSMCPAFSLRLGQLLTEHMS
jgi:hypothetical protein